MATGIVGHLRARLGLDAAPFQRGLNQSRGAAGVFSSQVKRMMAGVGVAIAGAFSGRAISQAMSTIDAQSKLAKSLGTTTESMQVLSRAGDLAGVSMQGIEQGTKDLFRRLSQAAGGTGPAADALERLGLSAQDLIKLPLDQRIAKINGAIREFIPEAQRAAVAGALFGEEGSIALSRLDPATIAQATEELRAFGFAISQTDAGKIEAANDSISKLGLIAKGLISQITVALAPALDAMATAFAELMRDGGALRVVIDRLGENIGRITSYAAAFAGLLAGKVVAGLAAAAFGVGGLSRALLFMRGALIRTGIGALVIGAGELVYWFSRLVKGAGGFGEAMGLLGQVGKEVFLGIGRTGQGLFLILQGVGQGIAGAFTSAFAWIASRWDALVNGMAAPFNKLMESIGASARLGGSSLGQELGDASEEMISDAVSSIESGSARIKGAFSGVGAAAAELRAAMTRSSEDSADALDDATASADNFTEALDTAGGAGGGGAASLEKVKTAADKVKESMNQVRDAGRSAFVGLVTGAKSLRQAVGDLLGRMAELAANSAFDALISGFKKPSGGGKGLLGSIVSAIIPGFASGTNSAPGGLALVGERGRELVNLPRGSQVVPNLQTERMLGGGGGAGRVEIVARVENGSIVQDVRRISGDVAIEVVREGLTAYDRSTLPTSIARIRNDPLVIG